MKPPPVVRPTPPPDPRIGLWVTGGISLMIGLFLAVFDHPLVPLWQNVGLIPLTIGAAVGVAVLREKNVVLGVVASLLVVVWLSFQIFDFQILRNQTSIAPLFLFSGIVNLARATLKTVKLD